MKALIRKLILFLFGVKEIDVCRFDLDIVKQNRKRKQEER